ncbi:MAG: site-specific DNA-methyltransferase [Kiritimatiellae bacterium]|nr:site-specific DNA-methyltransferase [Kiritimatiellia bacterium]
MPIRHIPFFPDPIRGQALLDNFKRTLRYSGSQNAERLVRRGMPLYELETVESVGETPRENPLADPACNLVIRGECLAACAALRDAGRTVDLVYIDPPFASGADYAKKIYLRRNPKKAAELAEAERTLDSDDFAAFEEKMYGDVWEKEKYLNWMYTNLLAIKSVMSDNASIYVHLDWHIGHYVKILMDEVYGEENFRSEIIWKRSSAHSDNTDYANIHDTIFFYQIGLPVFNTPYIPYSKEYADQYYSKSDERGRFKDTDLSAKGLQGSGYTYEWKGKPGYWRCPISTMERYEQEGRIYYTSNGTPRLKQYLEEMQGVPAQDIWTDVFPVNSQAKEKNDYATQKPEALLERIIKASSNEGMTVADFFGGSGVTAAVAARLGRKFIHVDVGVNSIQTTRDRLLEQQAVFSVLEVKDGVSLYRNPVQTMDKLKSLIPGLRNEDSVDEFWEGAIHDSRLGLVPVYLPNLMDSASRILDEPLLFRIVHQAIPELPPEVKKVVVYYVQAEDLDALQTFIREQRTTLVEIELRDLKEILDDVVVNDEAEWTLEENATGDLTNPWKLTTTRFSSDRVRQKIEEYNQRGEANPGKRGFTPIRLSEEGLETLEAVAADCTSATGPFHADRDLRVDKLGRVILDGVKTGEFWDGTLSLPRKPLRLRFRNICGDETVVPAT